MRLLTPIMLLVLVQACLLSCRQKIATTGELIGYVENPENGLVKEVVRGEYKIKIQYRPKDLMIFQQVATGYEIDSLRAELAQYEYFVLSIAVDNKEVETYYLAQKPDQHKALIEYLNTLIGGNIYAVTDDGRKIPVYAVQYVPKFGASQATQILLIFDKVLDTNSDEITVVIADSFLGIGSTDFLFETKHILNTPKLSYTSQ